MADGDESLQHLAEWLTSWSWPLEKRRVLELASDHGWVLAGDEGESVAWDTGLPPGASAVVLDGVVESMRVRTSPRVDDDAGGRRVLQRVFTDQVEAVTGVLGPATEQSPGRRPVATWALANGAVLKVAASSTSCHWVVNSPHLVQVQRDLGPDA